MRRRRNRVTSLVMLAASCGIAACARSPVPPYAGSAPRVETLYVVAEGWHTGLGVAAAALSGPLAAFSPAPAGTRYLVFGWGKRDYYMAQNPGFGDLLAAAMPAPSVMLVVPLAEPPATVSTTGAHVFPVAVSQAGLAQLSKFLWASIAKDRQGLPRRLGDGPDPGSGFYASTGTYSLADTCNTWTAEALAVAGLPVTADGVVFAHQVVDRVRAIPRESGESAQDRPAIE